MEYSTPTFDVNLDPTGFVIDLDSLYAFLCRVKGRLKMGCITGAMKLCARIGVICGWGMRHGRWQSSTISFWDCSCVVA